MNGIAQSDLEKLSAFLDGELSPREAEKLKARLAADRQLSGTLESLRATKLALISLPEVSLPRTFALTPELVRPKRTYPILQLTTAVATLGFVLVIGVDLLLNDTGSLAPAVSEQALVAADQIEQQAGELAAAPVEAPASEESIAEDAEAEIAAGAEPAAESELNASEGEAQGFYRAEEGESVSEEDAAGRDALAEQAPAPEEALKAESESSLETAAEQAEEQTRTNALQSIEVGLGVVVIVLIGLTIWVRKRA